MRLADDRICFGCGPRNPRGLKLKFRLDPARRILKTRWTPTKELQGYAGIVHGGMIALVLDELMGNLLWTLKRPAVTAEMTVRFHRPARVHQPLIAQARVKSQRGRVFEMEAQIRTPAGKRVASASAICVVVSAFPGVNVLHKTV